jgi:hypothetical protein
MTPEELKENIFDELNESEINSWHGMALLKKM